MSHARSGEAQPGRPPVGFGLELSGFLARAARKRWARYRRQVERCAEECEPAAVHQWRVAARRWIALLDVLEEIQEEKALRHLQQRLKQQLKQSSPLRDVHVLRDQLERWARRDETARQWRERLARIEARQAADVTRQIRRIKIDRLRELQREGLKAMRRDLRQCRRPEKRMRRAVTRAFGRVKERHGRLDASDSRTIHRLRVAIKRFRYLVELLAPALAGSVSDCLRQLRRYQEQMGRIQDWQVMLSAWDAGQRGRSVPAPRNPHPFRAAIEQRLRSSIRRFLKTAPQMLSVWPPELAL